MQVRGCLQTDQNHNLHGDIDDGFSFTSVSVRVEHACSDKEMRYLQLFGGVDFLGLLAMLLCWPNRSQHLQPDRCLGCVLFRYETDSATS